MTRHKAMRWTNGLRRDAVTLIATGSALAAVDNGASAQIPCRYEVSAIIQGPPCAGSPHAATFGLAISPNGRYVCGYWTCIGSDRAFVFDTQTNQFTTLPLGPGFLDEQASGVNDAGMICGTGDKNNAGQRGFVYNINTGQFTELLPQNNFPFGWSGANAINSSGTVCGFRSIDDGGDPVNPYTAFIWSPSAGFTDLGLINGYYTRAYGINDAGMTVGSGGVLISASERGFVFCNGAMTVLPPIPGGLSSTVLAVNGNGAMLVSGLIQTQTQSILHSYLVLGNVWQGLPALDGFAGAHGAAIANDGTVVGDSSLYDPPSLQFRACIWRDGLVTDIAQLLPEGSGLFAERAWAIAENGKIVGQGVFQHQVVGFVLDPVWSLPGDANCDQRVNVDDLLIVINHWGPCQGCDADQNRDAVVDLGDLIIILNHWTTR